LLPPEKAFYAVSAYNVHLTTRLSLLYNNTRNHRLISSFLKKYVQCQVETETLFGRRNDSAKNNLLKLAHDLNKLRYDALLSNPLLDFEKLLLLKRRRGQLGLPVNHKCNTGIERTGYDNEIAVLAPVRPGESLQTLFRPPGGQEVPWQNQAI